MQTNSTPANGRTTCSAPGLNGQAAPTTQQRRALRKLLRDLVCFTGPAINDLAATPRRKAPQPQQSKRRLLYRRADTLTDADLDRLLADEIGFDRWWAAAERATQPPLPFAEAAE